MNLPKTIFDDTRVQSTVPIEKIDKASIAQIQNALANDFVIKIMIFPDIHAGYDIPIGCSVITENVVVPAYIGYDIGCSVSKIEIPMNHDNWKSDAVFKRSLFDALSQKLHMGVGKLTSQFADVYTEEIEIPFRKLAKSYKMESDDIEHIIKRGTNGLGTLGSGNHFIEIGRSEDYLDKNMHITIHTGSRGFGYAIADYFIKKYPNGIDIHKDESAYVFYMRACSIASKFVKLNHNLIYSNCEQVIGIERKNNLIMCTHNAVEYIDSFTFIHRKGCTEFENNKALIPGNMADGVFLVEAGAASNMWYDTCSHGAGRRMSRNEAKKSVDISAFKEYMERVDVIGIFDERNSDESPNAYKNIFEVIEPHKNFKIINSENIKRIIPVINLKGV